LLVGRLSVGTAKNRVDALVRRNKKGPERLNAKGKKVTGWEKKRKLEKSGGKTTVGGGNVIQSESHVVCV